MQQLNLKFGGKKKGQQVSVNSRAKNLGVMRAARGSVGRSSVYVESRSVCSFVFSLSG